MALALSTLRRPVNEQVVDPSTGKMRDEWARYFDNLTERLNLSTDALSVDPAPADAEYIVASASATLTAERVVTDTATISKDVGTAAQLKLNVVDDSITNAKLANMAQATVKGRASGAGTGDPTDLTAAQARTAIGAVNIAGDVMTGRLDISAGNSVADTEFLRLLPTDQGTNKPYLGFKKNATADKYDFILWDGTDTDGTINFYSSRLTFNDRSLSPNIVAATPYTTSAAITSVIPYDDTVPLSSEGDQILTASITLTSTSSRVLVQFTGFGSNGNTGEQVTASLFRGTTCIDVTTGEMRAGNATVNLCMTTVDSPATAGSVTYSVRVGASSSTVRMNGTASARKFGGAAAATLTLMELT